MRKGDAIKFHSKVPAPPRSGVCHRRGPHIGPTQHAGAFRDSVDTTALPNWRGPRSTLSHGYPKQRPAWPAPWPKRRVSLTEPAPNWNCNFDPATGATSEPSCPNLLVGRFCGVGFVGQTTTAIRHCETGLGIEVGAEGMVPRGRFPRKMGGNGRAHCRSLGCARDDKARGVAQVGVATGKGRNSRSLHYAPLRSG